MFAHGVLSFTAITTLGVSAMAFSAISDEARIYPTRLPFEYRLPGGVTDYEVLYSLGPLFKPKRPEDEGLRAREYVMREVPLSSEGLVLESLAGRCGAEYKPWMLVRHRRTRRGIGISLAYPGNWRIAVLPDGDNTLLRVGALPESLVSFTHLPDGLPVPGALVTEFIGSWDSGAQPLVAYIRKHYLRDLGPDWPWVDFNTWFDCGERLDMDHLKKVARLAAELGCELFVIDTGWYGSGLNWHEALGEWHVNRERFPEGLEPFVKFVRELGMRFGIWFEIENTGKNARVVKEHPDWLLRDGDRLMTGRGCLDFGKPEVVRWACEQIERIIEAYNVDYLKMDFNTNLIEDSLHHADPTSPLSRHYQGLGQLWEHLHAKYPHVVIENCSSGSLRQELFTVALTDTNWVSDQVGNAEKLAINYGATYLFPPEINHHWTCYPEASDALDLEACFTVSMLGHMGISGPILEWTDEAKRQAKKSIALYKRLRPVIRRSVVYHLTSQVRYGEPNSVEAALYVDGDDGKALLFAFQGGAPELECTLQLQGLEPEATYEVVMPEGYGPDRETKGAELMRAFKVRFPHKGASAIVQFIRK